VSRIRIIRTVDAPPEAVFGLYVDASRLSEWQPGLRGIRDQTGPLDEPGTTYILDQPGPELRVRVTRVDRPNLHHQVERLSWYGWEVVAQFDPLPGERTRLSFSASYAIPGLLGRILTPVVVVAGWWFGRAEVKLLKRVAERDRRLAASPAGHDRGL
jgi:uncharacterized membrane protein